jgi:hypothetical protein
VNHKGKPLPTARPSDPAGATTGTPSRYDVYQYEIANNLINDAAKNGETGSALASYDGPDADITAEPDRRVVFAAVVECGAADLNGSEPIVNPSAFVSLFLTKPMVTSGSNKQIYVEVIDVTGFSGLGTLETVIREEASLVR